MPDDAYDNKKQVRSKSDSRAELVRRAREEQRIARQRGELLSFVEAKEVVDDIARTQREAEQNGSPLTIEAARARVLVENPSKEMLEKLKGFQPDHIGKMNPPPLESLIPSAGQKAVTGMDIQHYSPPGEGRKGSGSSLDDAVKVAVFYYGEDGLPYTAMALLDGAPTLIE